MFRNRHPHREAEAAASSRSHNLAARMGRWSAAHWKTATFGWLALVFLAFGIGGALGTHTLDPNTAGPGESGRMDRILDAGFKQPAHEAVLIQSNSLRGGNPAFRGCDRRPRRRPSLPRAVQHVRSPLSIRPTQVRSRTTSRCARRVRHPRRQGPRRRQDPPRARPYRRGAEGAIPGSSSGIRRRETPSGRPQIPHWRGSREGRALLAADHARHPRGRIRSPRRGGHPAAARADRRVQDVRAGRLPSQLLPIAQEASAMVLLHRACSRCRLLDVLPEAGPRGARRRAERAAAIEAAAATSGDSVLSPANGHRCDGRDVPDRRCDVRVLRRGHDPRRSRWSAR